MNFPRKWIFRRITRKYDHYFYFVLILILGAFLRVGNLDLKPLWMDEVITAIFSLGKNYNSLPLDTVISLDKLQAIFTYQPATCAEITNNLINQSTHPPLFFCAMHIWMGWLQNAGMNLTDLIVSLRLFSVIFGVAAIASIYILGYQSFSRSTGLIAAICMAVSPFGVYLSQEARHYTLPIFIITLAFTVQIHIQRNFFTHRKVQWWLWCGWIAINSLGLYIHYFFILVIIAQILTMLGVVWQYSHKQSSLKPFLSGLFISIFLLFLTYLPWFQILLTHSSASETDWLPKPQHIAPIYQTLINWTLMFIAFPVEHQPLIISIFSAILMLIFAWLLGIFLFKRLRQLILSPQTNIATYTFISLLAILTIEIFAIAYIFQKDITSVPRYSFIWYPSICILMAATLDNSIIPPSWQSIQHKNQAQIYTIAIVLLGIISSIFVNHNLVFQKPFLPEKTAQTLTQNTQSSVLIVMAYRDYQDIALGLSFALAIPPQKQQNTKFALLKQTDNFSLFWQNLAQLEILNHPSIQLWVFAPARKRHDYPSQITKLNSPDQILCDIDTNQHYRIGIPYQLYRCE